MVASERVELNLFECDTVKTVLSEHIAHLESDLASVNIDIYASIKALHGKFSAFCNVLDKKEFGEGKA